MELSDIHETCSWKEAAHLTSPATLVNHTYNATNDSVSAVRQTAMISQPQPLVRNVHTTRMAAST